jgi:hypothetical protein
MRKVTYLTNCADDNHVAMIPFRWNPSFEEIAECAGFTPTDYQIVYFGHFITDDDNPVIREWEFDDSDDRLELFMDEKEFNDACQP